MRLRGLIDLACALTMCMALMISLGWEALTTMEDDWKAQA